MFIVSIERDLSRKIVEEYTMPRFISTASGHQIDLDFHVPNAISKAMEVTKNVCRRDHIKAVDRVSRAGLFVTELRRQIGQIPLESRRQNLLIDGMCNPSLWTDIGVVNQFQYVSANEIVTKEWIFTWVKIASELAPTDLEGSTKAMIDELDGDLKSFEALLSRAREINSEADRVLGGLATLAEQNA
jgi:hypothetical protein